MSLASGTKLAEYEILSLLGVGGMGEVYRARDTKLRREVAIKVLPEEFSGDKERLARFEREARALASLNHPNIAAIYGFEQAEGLHYLVMELVPGDTLAELLMKGRLSVEEALSMARQMAEAVEAAHEKGIIHRDLKPANVKVTAEGKVIVLDFGLAKAFSVDTPTPAADSSLSPTLTRDATRAGVILGTAAYMSPEQARGRSVDKRSDVFAFGSVVYEMLTGVKVFRGEDISEILAAVIKTEPDWSLLSAGLDPRIRKLLERCFVKDPRERLRDIGDARIEIGEVLASPVSETVADVPERRRPRAHVLTALAATGATALIMWLFLGTPARNRAAAPVGRATISLPEGQSQRRLLKAPIAISPDGSLLAYAAEDAEGSGLFLRSLDRFETRKLSGTEGADMPFFSPDGQWVGFFAAGRLKKVSVERGAPLTITKAPDGLGASWAADDTIVFAPAETAGLFRVSADGGVPELLTEPDFAEAGYAHGWPDHLPRDREVLFSVWETGGGAAAVLNLETRDWHVVHQTSAGAQYLSTGHIIFSHSTIGGGLLATPFDGARPAVTGPTVSVVDAVRFHESRWPFAAVSQTGTLVYVRKRAEPATLGWMDREGTMTPIRSHVSLTAPRLSPDGERVLFHDVEGSIWVLHIPRGTIDVLASPATLGGKAWGPVWNPDGRRITFSSNRAGRWDLYEISVSGTRPAESPPSPREQSILFILVVGRAAPRVPRDPSCHGFRSVDAARWRRARPRSDHGIQRDFPSVFSE